MNDLLLNDSASFDSADSSKTGGNNTADQILLQRARSGDAETALGADDSLYAYEDEDGIPPPAPPLQKKSMRAGAQGIFRSFSSHNKSRSNAAAQNNNKDVLLIESVDSVESVEPVSHKRSYGKNKTLPSVYLLSKNNDPNMADDDESVEGVALDAYYESSRRRRQRKRRKLCLVALGCLLVAATLLGLVIGIQNKNDQENSQRSSSSFVNSSGGSSCVNAIDVTKTCFEFGEPISFDISNCDPLEFDWGGIWWAPAAQDDLSDLGNPIDWAYLCGSKECESTVTSADLELADGLDLKGASFVAHLVHRNEGGGGPYASYAQSLVFSIADSC